jgi:hypothetical protein
MKLAVPLESARVLDKPDLTWDGISSSQPQRHKNTTSGIMANPFRGRILLQASLPPIPSSPPVPGPNNVRNRKKAERKRLSKQRKREDVKKRNTTAPHLAPPQARRKKRKATALHLPSPKRVRPNATVESSPLSQPRLPGDTSSDGDDEYVNHRSPAYKTDEGTSSDWRHALRQSF